MLINCKKVFFPILVLVILFLSIPGPGFCHRVNIFCWVEGNRVKCEAKFTPGGPVKGGQIVVYSQQTGERLLTTSTDKEGKASFEIPEKARNNRWDLKVVGNAEMGHKNFWVVKADEFPSTKMAVSFSSEKQPPKGPALSAKGLEKLISRNLSSQLAPIKKDLAELKENRISIQDIFGGLGYIFGLAGVAFYFLGKREKRG